MSEDSEQIPSNDRLLPSVAIVGRPNVGKSALFNRLAGRRIAIVHDEPGITRDRIHAVCKLGKRPFDLVDTGGIAGAVADGFEDVVEREAAIAIEVANVILFVVDGQTGLTPPDQQVASRLRRGGKSVLLIVNKIDHERHRERWADFSRLGFEVVVGISAVHGIGIGELVSEINTALESFGDPWEEPELEEAETHPLRVAIVGRPNAGKSSLINALLGDERTIVSDVAGTTRDAVDVPCRLGEREAVLIDTAGLRHKRHHRTSVEVFSAMRAEDSIERADLCLLVVDANEGVTSQDKRIGQLIQEATRPCIIVGSKFDLLKDKLVPGQDKELMRTMAENLFFLPHAPLVFLSAHTGDNLTRLYREIARVERGAGRRIGTGPLNRLIQEVQSANPPPVVKGRRLKILYATALEDRRRRNLPVPVFVLFVNDTKLMPDNYVRYLEGRIRKLEPYPGLPIQFRLRGREAGKERP